jgi:hypothetical protein
MSERDNGGPVHPQRVNHGMTYTDFPGMSLRDWFAGQALAGIMANPERWRDIARRYDQGKMSYDDASKSNAVKAYNIADAMLAARNPTPTKGE